MNTSIDALEERWAALPRPAGALLEAERVIDWPGGRVLAAVDTDNRRHLLVELPDAEDEGHVRPMRGLEIRTRRLRIHNREAWWIDLTLNDPSGTKAFSTLSAELLEALSVAPDAGARVVLAVIERWRRFWTAAPNGMSRESQLGLTGELWLLLQWLPALTPSSVAAWRGPLGGRHDFVSRQISVEVKTNGTASGPATHRVGSLAQLDEPGTGRLYLLSLRMSPDPLGAVSLDELVTRARTAAMADGPDLAGEVDRRLAAYGWSPLDAGRYADRMRMVSEQLFSVEGDFPRLTARSFPHGLPDGVHDVEYKIDTSACGPWLVETSPDQNGALTSIALA